MLRWHRFEEAERLVESVATAIVELARGAIDARGEFQIVLAGGSTPRRIYRKLRDAETVWRAWAVFFGDERCLAVGDTERNDTMACAMWLNHVPIPRAQVHRIPAELGPDAAAAQYARLLADRAEFDLTVLGLGEDGHTASLFPGHELGVSPGAPDVLAVHDAPKPPPERVSLSAQRLSRSKAVYLIVLGSGKREAVERLRAGADIPARYVAPSGGVDVFLDQAAAGAGLVAVKTS